MNDGYVLAVKVKQRAHGDEWRWLYETECGLTVRSWSERRLFHSRIDAQGWVDHFISLGDKAKLVRVTRRPRLTSNEPMKGGNG